MFACRGLVGRVYLFLGRNRSLWPTPCYSKKRASPRESLPLVNHSIFNDAARTAGAWAVFPSSFVATLLAAPLATSLATALLPTALFRILIFHIFLWLRPCYHGLSVTTRRDRISVGCIDLLTLTECGRASACDNRETHSTKLPRREVIAGFCYSTPPARGTTLAHRRGVPELMRHEDDGWSEPPKIRRMRSRRRRGVTGRRARRYDCGDYSKRRKEFDV